MVTAADSYPAAAHYRYERWAGPGGIVLLHGLGADLGQLWDVTDGRVGGKHVSVLAPDARAHGGTVMGTDGPLSFDLLARDVLALVEQVGLGPRVVLVGLSMGAATALRVALARPEVVQALVLVRPAWLHYGLPANLAPLAEIGGLLARLGTSEGRAAFEASEGYQRAQRISPSTAASLLSQFDKPLARERARRLIDIPRSVPYASPAEASTVAAPTLVVGAGKDPTHPLEFADQLAHLIPGARLTVVTARDEDADQHRAGVEAAIGAFMEGIGPA